MMSQSKNISNYKEESMFLSRIIITLILLVAGLAETIKIMPNGYDMKGHSLPPVMDLPTNML